MAGRYKKVSVLVKKLSEFAAGLSDVENDGGMLFIKSILVARRMLAVVTSTKILSINPFSFA